MSYPQDGIEKKAAKFRILESFMKVGAGAVEGAAAVLALESPSDRLVLGFTDRWVSS